MVVPLHKREAAVTETKSAALVLVVLHVVCFVFMAGYRLHTQQYYLSEAARAEEAAAKSSARQEQILRDNPLAPYTGPLEDLSQQLSNAQESILVKTNLLLRHMQKLKSLNKTTTDLPLTASEETEDDPKVQPAVSSSSHHWRDLISVGSLREIPDDELEAVFGNATEEIRELVKKENQPLIQRFNFDTSLGSSIAKEASAFVCPKVNKTAKQKQPKGQLQQRHPGAAYESDLTKYLEVLETKFGNRVQAKGIHALSPESVKELEEETTKKVQVIFEDIDEFADELDDKVEESGVYDQIEEDGTDRKPIVSSSSSSCIDRDLVTALITAGLNAQLARADVREALRKTLLEFTSEDDLILDADLDSIGGRAASTRGSSSPAPKTRRIEKINLRSMIDSPLLVKSVDWIDGFIDTIGGYSDELDAYLDSLTGYHGTTSVGEIVVEHLLEQAGRLGDVDVQKYVDTVEETLRDMTGRR